MLYSSGSFSALFLFFFVFLGEEGFSRGGSFLEALFRVGFGLTAYRVPCSSRRDQFNGIEIATEKMCFRSMRVSALRLALSDVL